MSAFSHIGTEFTFWYRVPPSPIARKIQKTNEMVYDYLLDL
jgi:hypothetical protein